MAKTAKSGLGRGLNSLLKGSFESDMPFASQPARDRVTVSLEEENLYGEKSEIRRIEERTPVAPAPLSTLQDVETSSTQLSSDPKKVDEVSISLVVPNPDQPRTNFKKEEIDELALSIEKDGLLQPILVREMPDGKYQIIAGERRWQASCQAGLDTVPIRIKDVDDDEALELALVENIQRSDLNPIEEAYGYRRLMERKNMTQADVAQAVSKGRSTVANALRLLELPEEAQQLLYEDKITAGHARAILSIPSKEGRETLTKKMIATKMTVREAEALARLLAGKETAFEKPRQVLPASYKAVAKTLRDVLGTNVRVKSSKGKNKIEIEFKDEEDLERLFEEITAVRG